VDSQHRVKALALVHEQLHETNSLARIDLAAYLRRLVGHLARALASRAAPISWQVNSANVFVGIDAAIGCGLIVHELASNSFKHAFPDGRAGQVVIDLCPQPDGSVELRFGDDGVGLPKELDFDQAQSLGLQLVRLLTRQLKGTMECRNGSGTQFTLCFSETNAT